MIRTQIQIEDQQAEWLKAAAKERGVSVSLWKLLIKREIPRLLYDSAMETPGAEKKSPLTNIV